MDTLKTYYEIMKSSRVDIQYRLLLFWLQLYQTLGLYGHIFIMIMDYITS